MTLSAILNSKKKFLGVVPSDMVLELTAQEGVTDYTEIKNVKLGNSTPEDCETVYEAEWDEFVEDMDGNRFKVVYK